MKKYLNLLWCCLLILLNSIFDFGYAQITWKKKFYDLNNNGAYLKLADMDIKYDSVNNKFIFLGMSHSTEGKTSIYEIGATGNLLFRNYYSGSGGSEQNLKFTSDNGIIISDAEPYNSYVVKTLFKIDSSFNIQWKYKYDFQLSISKGGLQETFDHNYLLTGTHYTPSPRPVFLKIDSMGNLIWSKQLNSLKGLSNFATLSIASGCYFGINSYLDGKGAILCKSDTSGNLLWSKSFFRPKGYLIDMFEKQNGHLILIGSSDITTQTQTPVLFIMELDTSGNVQWTKTYGDNLYQLEYNSNTVLSHDPIKIIQTFDGGFLITTTIYITSTANFDLVLLKTDSSGNIEWERRHGDVTDYEGGIDVMQTPDSGYFVVGSFSHYTGFNYHEGYYILKTDSLGKVAGCLQYSDTIPQNSINTTDSSIVVTDSVITINRYPALVHDTTDTGPFVEDGCIPDGIPEIVNDRNELSIYPNPSSGVFNFFFHTNDIIEKTEVFNYLGERVLIKEGNVFQIDLNKAANGMYFYSVKAKEGRIFSGKIIKE